MYEETLQNGGRTTTDQESDREIERGRNSEIEAGTFEAIRYVQCVFYILKDEAEESTYTSGIVMRISRIRRNQ